MRNALLRGTVAQPASLVPRAARHQQSDRRVRPVNVLPSGPVIVQHDRGLRHQEFSKFLTTIDEAEPTDLDVYLVLEDYATRKTEAVKKWLQRHPRFHLHFTPRPGCPG